MKKKAHCKLYLKIEKIFWWSFICWRKDDHKNTNPDPQIQKLPGSTNSEASWIHKFRTFPDPQIWNLPGTTNSRFYHILWSKILSDSIIWNGRKHLRKQKFIKKMNVQIWKQRNLLIFVKNTLNHQQKMWDWRRRIWRCRTALRTWKRAAVEHERHGCTREHPCLHLFRIFSG